MLLLSRFQTVAINFDQRFNSKVVCNQMGINSFAAPFKYDFQKVSQKQLLQKQ